MTGKLSDLLAEVERLDREANKLSWTHVTLRGYMTLLPQLAALLKEAVETLQEILPLTVPYIAHPLDDVFVRFSQARRLAQDFLRKLDGGEESEGK